MISFEPWLGAQRWAAMWQALGVNLPQEGLHGRLLDAWSEPQRAYHSRQHLAECLAMLEPLRGQAQRPAEIELALWFHDAVYDTRRKDNEERSADWARTAALSAGLGPEVAARLHHLVMLTRHQALPVATDEILLIDVDLSILGADAARFAEYEQQIQREYSWVPVEQRGVTRRRILQSFLDRPRIYGSDAMHQRLEARARENLAKSIAALETRLGHAPGAATMAPPTP